MPKNYKNILSLTTEEVLDFFMKSEQFHGFELPEYFDFDEVLSHSVVPDKLFYRYIRGI